MKKALVLGVGNILLQDEGIGVRVIEHLKAHYLTPDNIKLLDGGTMGLELMTHLDGIDHLLIIDAAETGKAPGTIICLRGDEVPFFLKQKISPHQLGISDLLSVAELQGLAPPTLTLIGVQPKELDTGLELSKTVREKVPEIAQMALDELATWGYPALAKI